MPSDPGQLRIRNQRYPRRVVVAENVLVGGLLVSFVVIEILGLWLLGTRTTVCVLLACHLAISPVVIRGWLLIWDLNRAGPPRRGVTARRALYEGVFLGIGRKELPAAIGWTAHHLGEGVATLGAHRRPVETGGRKSRPMPPSGSPPGRCGGSGLPPTRTRTTGNPNRRSFCARRLWRCIRDAGSG